MTHNPYVFELDQEDFDIKQLQEIFSRRQHDVLGDPQYENYHRLVIDEPYMQSIRNEYAFLSSIYNIYEFDGGIPAHIDQDRKCTLNFPLWNCADTSTVVYEIPKTNTADDRWMYPLSYPVDTSQCEELYRFELNQPLLFNVEYPHEVVVPANSAPRISISWSIDEMSFASTRKVFERRRLL